MSGDIPTDALRGKIVIVGVTAESVRDFMATPLNRNHRPIELQAQFVDQLLRAALDGRRPRAVWGEWRELAWTFAWCLLGGLIGMRVHSPLRFCLALSAGGLVLVLVTWGVFCQGWWIPLVPPLLAFLPTAAVVVSYQSHFEKDQRTMLQQLFQKLVSPEVANAVWERREEFLDSASGRPISRKATATVMFADLKGFTLIAERMEPAKLMDWLNEYMKPMTEVVIRHEGMVRHFSGDAIMAVFGFPEIRTTLKEIKHDAMNAVGCALAMERELERLNANWHEQGLPHTSMRVGIYTGELVAGTLGSAQRMEYTVLGDTVNIASRLETLDREVDDAEADTRCCRIFIGESTHSLLDKQFDTKLVTTLNLKGKSMSVTVYRVLGHSTAKREGQYEI
jgi:adenylate cyclase